MGSRLFIGRTFRRPPLLVYPVACWRVPYCAPSSSTQPHRPGRLGVRTPADPIVRLRLARGGWAGPKLQVALKVYRPAYAGAQAASGVQVSARDVQWTCQTGRQTSEGAGKTELAADEGTDGGWRAASRRVTSPRHLLMVIWIWGSTQRGRLCQTYPAAERGHPLQLRAAQGAWYRYRSPR